MSILRNIAIGALGEGINRMEQKDRMYAEIAVNAGKNYFTNVLPESIKAENFRKSTYDKIYSITGDRNFTELMDRDGFTTQKNGVELAQQLYKNIDKEKLKAATFQTSYEDRYNQRIKSRDEMYQPMLKELGFGIGAMGPNTMKSLVEEDFVTGKDTQTAKKPTEAADMAQQTDIKDTDAAPATTTISDFLISKPVTFQLAETEFARVAQNYGFGNAIKFSKKMEDDSVFEETMRDLLNDFVFKTNIGNEKMKADNLYGGITTTKGNYEGSFFGTEGGTESGIDIKSTYGKDPLFAGLKNKKSKQNKIKIINGEKIGTKVYL